MSDPHDPETEPEVENDEVAMRIALVEDAAEQMMIALGVPIERGTAETPRRIAKMWVTELTAGLRGFDPAELLGKQFDEGCDGIVIVRSIPFHSVCEHHFVPFYGVAHIGYLPNKGRVVGISKLARLVRGFARRPSVQERLTSQVVDALMTHLQCRGAACVISAEHLCMTMRGVQVPGTQTITSAVRGVFLEKPEARNEFMTLIRMRE